MTLPNQTVQGKGGDAVSTFTDASAQFAQDVEAIAAAFAGSNPPSSSSPADESLRQRIERKYGRMLAAYRKRERLGMA